MRRAVAGVVVAAVLAVSSAAMAQTKAAKAPKPKPKKPDKTIVVDDPDKVIGEPLRPGDPDIVGRPRGEFDTMIRYRETFVDRIIRTGDDIS
jgi:hypothetical protein